MLSHKDIWNNCLESIKKQIPEKNFNIWFKPIIPQAYANDTLTIQVPSQFFYEWLEKNYIDVLKKTIKSELGEKGKLEYSIIVDKGNTNTSPYLINLPSKNQNKINKNIFGENAIQLNSSYTFENFIEGDSNQLVKSAAQAIAKRLEKTSFNPFMVYSGVGLGKTHIVQAIGNYIKQENPNKNVVYMPTEKFTSQFIDSLKNGETKQFAEYYTNIDLLILDDVQFLIGKEKTQEVFFHIFNNLYQSKKQIIITSDCSPGELKGLQDRLLSRFKWGLTADIQQPDFETRIAIIKSKIKTEGIIIPNYLIEYIASSITTNIREMEGVVISILAKASLNKKDIDLELVKNTINNITSNIKAEVGIDYIQKVVAKHFNINLIDLTSKSRKKEIVAARNMAIYTAKLYTKHSLKAIGSHFGGKNHSTIVHAINSIEEKLKIDNKIKEQIEVIKKSIRLPIK